MLAGLTIILAGCASSPSGAGTTSTRQPDFFIELPPTKRSCRGSELAPALFLQGATGKLIGGMRFRVTGDTACSIHFGPPRVSFIGTSAPVDVYLMPAMTPRGDARPNSALGSLRRGDRVVVDLVWSNWCSGRPPRTLSITLPIERPTFRIALPFGTPRCDSAGRPSRLGVGPVVPLR